MKKVVLAGWFEQRLLSPYWAIKFLEKKGYKNVKAYQSWDSPSGYSEFESASDMDSFFRHEYISYSEKDLEGVRECCVKDKDLIPYEKLIKNREDKDLIEIAEQVSDNDVKIMEIPDDVEYTIKEKNGFETIVEKHRVWKYI